ncbi:MAG: hypothetical protein Q9159_007305, partial [Coniocarpon cinnabarinum]
GSTSLAGLPAGSQPSSRTTSRIPQPAAPASRPAPRRRAARFAEIMDDSPPATRLPSSDTPSTNTRQSPTTLSTTGTGQPLKSCLKKSTAAPAPKKAVTIDEQRNETRTFSPYMYDPRYSKANWARRHAVEIDEAAERGAIKAKKYSRSTIKSTAKSIRSTLARFTRPARRYVSAKYDRFKWRMTYGSSQ